MGALACRSPPHCAQLHHLALTVEQHRVHLAEIGAHPREAERASGVLKELLAELGRQQRYCDLLDGASLKERERFFARCVKMPRIPCPILLQAFVTRCT
jgi:hypothetical protein